MITKSDVNKQMEQLPEQFSIDELIEKLILIEKIEKGIKESDKNQVRNEIELKKEIDKWFK